MNNYLSNSNNLRNPLIYWFWISTWLGNLYPIREIIRVIYTQQFEVTKYLIERGANINYQDRAGLV